MSHPFRRAADLAVVERADHVVILDLRQLDEPEPIHIDGTGLAIWLAIDGQRDRAEIVAAVASAYGVPSTDVEPDVTSFLDDLERRALVTISPPAAHSPRR